MKIEIADSDSRTAYISTRILLGITVRTRWWNTNEMIGRSVKIDSICLLSPATEEIDTVLFIIQISHDKELK